MRTLVSAVCFGLVWRVFVGIAQGVLDAPLGYLVLPVDALGVDLQQDQVSPSRPASSSPT